MEARWLGIVLIGLSIFFTAVIVVGAIGFLRSSGRGSKRGLPRMEDSPTVSHGSVRLTRLLSDSEAAFYWTLRKAVGDRWVIAVKVPLTQIMRKQRRLPSGLYTMLENGHVDFLLLHPRSWEPVIGIELDDTTHRTAIRRERDQRKDELFRIAGLPLLRYEVGQSWSVEEIARAIWRAASIDEA